MVSLSQCPQVSWQVHWKPVEVVFVRVFLAVAAAELAVDP